MSKLLVVEIPESESAHLTALGFVMGAWELPTADELGRAAFKAAQKYRGYETQESRLEVGNAILGAIRRKS